MTEVPARASTQPTVTGWLWAVTAGLLAFVGSWVAGVAIVAMVIRAIPPEAGATSRGY
ncbi:MAG TPA: hypothetical protein VG122_16190 [Gemmata sp.]|jgi:hypothetical protein|nr:hypothetical protein [Gemmata sp.]